MHALTNSRSSERGAMLVHVAIGMIAFMALCALAVDFGVKWVGRTQAQAAADAGALAGATALAFDDPTPADLSAAGVAKRSARAYALSNWVWNLAPDVDINTDITFPPCPPPNVGDTCVQVDVYRNQERANPLPTFFARLVGVTEQGVKATATAMVLSGNSTTCMRPWAIPDRWSDNLDDPQDNQWTWDDKWERYFENGPNAGELMPGPVDEYVRPTDGPPPSPGSGFTLPDNLGDQVRLKAGNPAQSLTAGWFFPIDLPRLNEPDTGGDRYRDNIAGCNGLPVGIGDLIWNEPGDKIGPTRQGVNDLIARDPNSYWDPGSESVKCSTSSCPTPSPRIVPIPVFNPDAYSQQDKTSGKFQIEITNILGFYIERMQGNDVIGYFLTYPGDFNPDNDAVPEEAAFLKQIILVR